MIDVNSLLSQIEGRLVELSTEPNDVPALYDPVFYSLRAGGKRLRPLLCCLCAQVFSDYQMAMDAAIAIELYHNHTLVHDDIMDRSPLRRGCPTVYSKWGEEQAILSGDAMLLKAYDYLGRMQNKEMLVKVLPLFTRMALLVCEGQQYDIEFESRANVSIDEYLRMIRLKTAELPAYAARIGAVCSLEASPEEVELVYDFAIALGMAFQLQDDYLDVYAESSVFGKPIGGDIVNNKKTFLLLSAYDRACDKDAEALARWMADHEPDRREAKIEWVRSLYDRLSIPRLTQESIARYNLVAEEALEALHQRGRDVASLRSILRSLDKRRA